MKPEECKNMGDIRQEIDGIDRNVVRLFGQRFKYVKKAAEFKTDEQSVKAPERFKAMLLQRREWAAAEGLNADVIESLYKDLVNYFIKEELTALTNHHG